MVERKENIVTVGGGTGSPTLNRALLLSEEVENIDAIAAMFDNGGETGRRRARSVLDAEGQEVAYSDGIRIMLSLIDPKQATEARIAAAHKILLGRNKLTDEVPGYALADAHFDKERGFEDLQELITQIGVNFMGRVLPSSTEPAHIRFRTKNNQDKGFRGEDQLDYFAVRGSTDMVIDMVLEPSVPGYPPAREALKRASAIFLSCGSIHGSVVCNFLPEGMKESLAENKSAQVYLVTNLTSTSNENNEFSPRQYVDLVEKYLGQKGRINGIIVPEISRRKFESDHPDVVLLYSKEGSHFMGWEQETLSTFEQESGVRVITHHATEVVSVPDKNKKIVRHSPEDLAPVLASLLKENT